MIKIQKCFIQNLKFFRINKKYTQAEIAEMLDISVNYYSAIECGKYFPSLNILNKICNSLCIPPAQLFMSNQPNSFPNTKTNEDLSIIKEKVNNIIDLLNNKNS